MSKVNSFKCDICGEVYHVTEGVPNEYIIMHKHRVSADEGEVTSYEHICPTCEGNIRMLLDDPTLIDEQEETIDSTREFANKLRVSIRSLHRTIHGIFAVLPEDDIEYEAAVKCAEEIFNDRKKQLNELSDVRDGLSNRINTQLWAIRILALLLGLCMGSALAQIIF